MATPTGVWRCVPGKNMGSGETMRCLVTASDISGIDKVTFAVAVNGGSATDHDVSTENYWVPNDTEFVDPIGNCSTLPAKLWCYGYTIDPAALSLASDDYVDVTPTVTPISGTPRVMPTQRYYYDATPPSSAVIYVGADGNDANDGLSEVNAVKSVDHAMSLASVGGFCGGATIYVVPGAADLEWREAPSAFFDDAKTGPTNSDFHWVTFKPAPGYTRAECRIYQSLAAPVYIAWGANVKCRLKLQDVTICGPKLTARSNTATQSFWLEHCLMTCRDPAYGPGQAFPHCDAYTSDSQGIGTDTNQQEILYATGCQWENVVGGMFNVRNQQGTMARGCKFLNCSGIPVYVFGDTHALGPFEFEGCGAWEGLKGATDVRDGTFDLIESPDNTGKVRIRQTGTLLYYPDNSSTPFGNNGTPADCAVHLIGATVYGFYIEGFTGYTNGTYYVLATGNDGTYDWFDLDLAYGAGVSSASGRRVMTAAEHDVATVVSTDEGFWVSIHGNLFYTDGATFTNFCLEDWRLIGYRDGRQITLEAADTAGPGLMRNVTSDPLAQNSDWDGTGTGDRENIIVEHCVFHSLNVRAGTNDYTNCAFRNNIFGQVTFLNGDLTAWAAMVGAASSNNNFIDATNAFGSSNQNETTPWAESDPNAAGDWTPAGDVVGAGTGGSDIGPTGMVVLGAWEDSSGSPYTMPMEAQSLPMTIGDMGMLVSRKMVMEGLSLPMTIGNMVMLYSGASHQSSVGIGGSPGLKAAYATATVVSPVGIA